MKSSLWPLRWRRLPLFWRVFAVNASVLALAAAMLALTPATVSRPVAATELLVLSAGIAVMLVVNLVLLRRAFVPLGRLAELAQSVDPLTPGQRVTIESPDPQVAALVGSLNEMLDRLETERRDSARRALAAQEDERIRIARELHDEIGQGLTAVLLQLETLARRADAFNRVEIEDVREAIRAMLAEVRDIARRLRPEALDDLGLISALTALATGFAKQSGLHATRRLDVRAVRLGAEEELVVYRVAQEALTNVVRHAEATSVEIALSVIDQRLVLTIRDDGKGIEPTALEKPRGIRGMRERAVLVGGTLNVGSRREGGAEVRLEMPVGKP